MATITDDNTALRCLLNSSCVEQVEGKTGEILHDWVLVLAARAGMAPETWMLQQATGPVKPKAGGRVVTGQFVNEEQPGDAKISDSALVELLRNENEGMEGAPWVKAARKATGISKGGFYVRLKKLVAEKQVLVSTFPETRMIYGRPVKVDVKWYHHPEELKANDLDEYNRLMGAEVARG